MVFVTKNRPHEYTVKNNFYAFKAVNGNCSDVPS